MQKIADEIKKIKKSDKTGLMTHVVCGCPSLKLSEKIILEMAKSGVNFIEIQIPFSDPVADGPVMMKANEIALAKGTRVRDAFSLAGRLTRKIRIPLFLMGYYNVINKMGVNEFCRLARRAGVSGLIFPDIPFDEARKEGFFKACRRYNLAPIQVVSENTTEKRLAQIKRYAKGFIYCTSRFGTTGLGKDFSKELNSYLKRVKKICALPLAVGFGISSKDDIKKIGRNAEVAVIGSAIMKITIDEKIKEKEKLKRIRSFIQKVRG